MLAASCGWTRPHFSTGSNAAGERYELDRGRVIMMTGGSRAHWQITFNLAKALDARLDPSKWAVLPESGVDLEPEFFRFLDVTVNIAGETAKDLTAPGPVLIAEVLSPGSERVDFGDKAAEYLRLPSLAAYPRVRPGPDESMGLDTRARGLLFRAGRTGRRPMPWSGSKHWASICP